MTTGQADNTRNAEIKLPATVTEQAAGESDLDMPLGSGAEVNRQLPRSGEGEGSVGDTANQTETGQSATLAPPKEQ